MQIQDFAAPGGGAPTAAVQLATDYHTPSMFNHVMRSWYLARGFAATEGWSGFDEEMLFVAAVLHDIGTTTAFDNHTLPYEEAGGHVAVALTAGAGWSTFRQQRTLQVIVRHNWASVDPSLDVEGYLLEAATALDIAGVRADLIDEGLRDEVLSAHPRLDLATEFVACVADQAERKPTSAAHRIERGLAERMRDHPFER